VCVCVCVRVCACVYMDYKDRMCFYAGLPECMCLSLILKHMRCTRSACWALEDLSAAPGGRHATQAASAGCATLAGCATQHAWMAAADSARHSGWMRHLANAQPLLLHSPLWQACPLDLVSVLWQSHKNAAASMQLCAGSAGACKPAAAVLRMWLLAGRAAAGVCGTQGQ